MKINKIFAGIVAGTVALAGFTGCNDEEFLKEHSYNYDDNSFYNTESDIVMALNPCYNTVEYLMLGEPHHTLLCYHRYGNGHILSHRIDIDLR